MKASEGASLDDLEAEGVSLVGAMAAAASLSTSTGAEKGESKRQNIAMLNVGGKRFATTYGTLTKYPHSMLGAMFSGRFALSTDEKGRFFIDRDGRHFGTILNYLRDGFVVVPESAAAKTELLVEAQYYQLTGLIDMLTPEERVRAAQWRWSPGSKSAYITLLHDYRTARAGEGKNWNTVLGDTGYSNGRHYFEIEITKFINSGGGWGISFGLIDVCTDFEYNHFGHRDNLPKGTRKTWSYVAATGKIFERGVEMSVARPFSVNDRVGLLLDFKHSQLQFFLNGQPEGQALSFSFSPEDPPLFPALSLNGGGDKFHIHVVESPNLPASLVSRKDKTDKTL
jgi:hypothetical protein